VLRRLAILAVAVIAAALAWRPAAAWWCLDVGNLAYLRGDRATAAADFSRGLEFVPSWRALREDHGRAVLPDDPATALADFKAAACGEPCLAEAGDAESRLGRFDDAVNDYLAAHAVERVGDAVGRLAGAGRFDDAIALERALATRLGTGMLAQADVASAQDLIGRLDQRAAKASRDKRKAAAYHADAIRSFRRASQLAPFNEGYLLSLGFAEASWGDKRSAREAFGRVLDLHPHESDAERGLAQLGSPGDDDSN
jgi:tetratricopeptide (TPR) repeat protein